MANYNKYILTILLIASFFCGLSQNEKENKDKKVRYGAWMHPNNVSNINGLAIGAFNTPYFNKFDELTVNGINLELIGGGLLVYFLPWPEYPFNDHLTVNGLCLAPTFWGGTNNGITLSLVTGLSNMKGFNLGLATTIGEKCSGVNINFLQASSEIMRGVQIGFFNGTTNGKGLLVGGLFNATETMNGLSIAAMNSSQNHNGVQIGLFNWSKKLNGLQVGLFNYAENSKIPFTLLFNYSKDKKE